MDYPTLANRRPSGSEDPKTNEAHTVSQHTDVGLYGYWLWEVPLDGGTMVVVDTAGPTTLTEVSVAPAAGEYRVHYTGKWLGFIEHNSADDATSVEVDYDGTGSAPEVGLLNKLIAEKIDRDGSIPFTGAVTVQLSALTGKVTDAEAALVLEEGSESAYLNIVVPNNKRGGILIGDPEDADAARWQYDHGADAWDLYGAGSHWARLKSGILLVGTTVTSGAAAGEIVLANDKWLRSLEATGTDTRPLIKMNTNSRPELGGSAGVVIIPNLSSPIGAGAANNGGIAIDTTNNRLVYYSGGNRYYLAGTSF